MNKFGYRWVVFVLCTTFFACSSIKNSNEDSLSILRIGILPDENKDQQRAVLTPLCQYLSEEIGVPYELIIPATYSELVDLFHRNKIDLAYFGGVTFVKANIMDNAVPLVMRDVDTRFTSYFLVKANNPATELSQFQGKSLSFGSESSTSGHLMPRYFLEKKNINPETFFSKVLFSGKHDKTATWVRDNVVDLGAANSKIINKMFKDGRLSKNDVRIIWETPPYADYVWALRSVFGKSVLIKIRDAFLNLSAENEVHAKILNSIDANSFLPASVDDFSLLRKIVEKYNQRGVTN